MSAKNEVRAADACRRPPRWIQIMPLALICAGIAAFFALGWHRYVSFETIRMHRSTLLEWIERWGTMAVFAYIGCYALMSTFSLPGGALAMMVGGYLFGTWTGLAASVTGSATGAVVFFIAARSALGDLLSAKAGAVVRRMEEGFRRDAFSYLLALRFVPLFPFWLVNLVPALCGVRLETFALATVFGIVPAALVFVSVGSGFGELIDRGGKPDLSVLLEWEILLPLMGLAVLALLPVTLRRLKAARAWRSSP